MGWMKKSLGKISIPAAFVICSLGGLLTAFGLTRLTAVLAQKGMEEISAKYGIQLDAAPLEKYVWYRIKGADVTQHETGIQLVPETEEQKVEYVLKLESASADTSGGESLESLGEVSVEFSGEISVETGVVTVYPQDFLTLNKVVYLEADRKKYDFFEGLESAAAVLWYSFSLCFAALLFYVWKIKKPFHILNQAMQKIADNDLNCPISYERQDECGRLCGTFERMRQELVRNNQKMWNSVEERKRLNGAFAHDLRTPLTVLRGHAELLYGALSREGEENEELLNSVDAMSRQITRLNAYVDTMSALQRLEDYEPCRKEVSAAVLERVAAETAELLFPRGERTLHCQWEQDTLIVDQEAFAQICENLLSNAARYAKSKIKISMGIQSVQERAEEKKNFLCFVVEDDGNGFSQKDLEDAALAYYRGAGGGEDGISHFGLGLSICKLLAEKMGGGLKLENGADGGALVTIKIRCD